MKTPQPSFPPANKDYAFAGSVLILLIAVAVYWPAIHAGFIWDDDDMLTNNPLITAPGGLSDIWSGSKFWDYWPLTLTSFWIEFRLWGLDPAGYHLVNVLLHAATAILFWRALRLLKIPAAWLSALIFAIHPINVQSVAWITERKNTLSLFLCAIALVWYLQFLLHGNRKQYWLAFAAFIFALLSKTSVVMLPFVLLCCAWWLRGKMQKKDLLHSLPFFAVGLILAIVTIWFQYSRSISTDVVNTNTFAARLINAGLASWFYLSRILFPRNPMFVYPKWNFTTDALNFVPGVLILLLVFLFWLFRKSWGRPFFFAFAFFLVMLFPVLGFFNIYFQKYSPVADYWLYPAMIGIIALSVGGVAHLLQRLANRGIHNLDPREAARKPELQKLPAKAPRLIGLVLGIAVCGTLAPLTWAQCRIYKNEETLWRATIKVNYSCPLAYHNLAGLLVERCKEQLASTGLDSNVKQTLKEALTYERRALHWKPDHAGAAYGAGYILSMLGQVEDAVPYYKQAVEHQPDMLAAVDSLAWILATHEKQSVRDGAEALRLAKSAVALSGDGDPKILETLAVAAAEAGDFASALDAARKGLALAEAAGDRELVRDFQMQLRLFEAKRPYRIRSY